MAKSTGNPTPAPVVLITGGSSGIGAATALALAPAHIWVALVARREDRLREVCAEVERLGGRALAIVADLADPAVYPRVIEQVRQSFGEIEILVNNAGFGWYGPFSEMEPDTAQQMLAVNVAATVGLTRLVLPAMRARGCGQIINVSSIAGSLPNQGIAMYSASKAFVDAFTISLHRELRGSGVRVSLVKPGAVKSGFWNAAREQPGGSAVPGESLAISAERVADAITSLIAWPRPVVYVPWIAWLTRWVEPCFGWFINLLGPLLLRRHGSSAPHQ